MLTVLMVEDDADYAEALSSQLEADGAIRSAGSGPLAGGCHEPRLAAFTPDLAVLDLGLPDGSGTALLAELPPSLQSRHPDRIRG